MLFDWRRPWPLLVVVLLHVLFFYALQAGLLRKVTEAPAMREVLAALLAPEPPPPVARAKPPKPLPTARPVQKPAAPQPPVPVPVNPVHSETAITLPPVPDRMDPVVIIQPPAPPAPVIAAPPAPPAPVDVEAPPVAPPRFDAAYLNNPPPAYPAFSRRTGEQGKVMLRVHVTAQGSTDEVTLKTSSGFPRLDESALNTVRQWRFVPARQGEQVVAAWVLVPLTFRLEG
ncbi:MAG: energy transducer TonB [Betaproteobacteria bacterium]